MLNKPRRKNRGIQNKSARARRRSAEAVKRPFKAFKKFEAPVKPTALHDLQDVLWEGAAVNTILWNYRSIKDWITNVHAADIDNDGDIEVLVGSRDGSVRAITPSGAKKWDWRWKGQYVSALCAVPLSDASDITSNPPIRTALQKQACVIVGMRSGEVYALDQDGKLLPDWHYETDRMIRQIYVSANSPGTIIIGSEDRCIHVLNRYTGELQWAPYQTNGWVRSIFCCDIDGDHKEEILAGSGDNNLYILDNKGNLLDKLFLEHQIYALYVAPLTGNGPMNILTSSNRKDLFVWDIQRRADGGWDYQKKWEKLPDNNLFDNRIHAIYVMDVNNDGIPEILLGSEDGYLYILDQQGELLWKRHFGSCVYSVWADDINFDGQVEILVGTEDSGVYAIQVDLSENIYKHVRKAFKEIMQSNQFSNISELMKKLTPRENYILQDFVEDTELEPKTHPKMQMETAIQLMNESRYEEALSLFLSLRRKRVQYYWEKEVETTGYIWTIDVGHVEDASKYTIVVGTDAGYIYAIDVEQGAEGILWQKNLNDRVRKLQIGELHPGEPASIAAVLANHRLVILNNQGEVEKEHTFKDKNDWARSVYIDTPEAGSNNPARIFIGMENNKISVWDAALENELKVVHTQQGISAIGANNLVGNQTPEIISGSIKNQVYAHDQDGTELWSFQTEDRIQALYARDIDRDGNIEVIIGSEDRNVYVLDHEGHLKWRYRTMRGVADVGVFDLKLDGDPEDASERDLKVVAGSSDGYLYLLTARGDLIWKYKSPNRIRAISAGDFNHDGRTEIAIASENKLELLHIPSQRKLWEYIQECWKKLLLESTNDRTAVFNLTYHPNKYIRAFALARLAGQHNRLEIDFKRFHEALRDERELEVKRELVRSSIVLYKIRDSHEGNRKQVRSFLRQLSADPEPEIRLAIVRSLSVLSETEESLCFEYFEHFTHNVDIWVRHAVVRELHHLIKEFPDRVFPLLAKTANDEEEWVRLESGRTLARYFDKHPERIINDALLLLSNRVKVEVLQQIAYSADKPGVKHWFTCLVHLLTDLNEQTLGKMLDETGEAIQKLQAFAPQYGDDLYQIYSEFRRISLIHSITGLARYAWSSTADNTTNIAYHIIQLSMHIFDGLHEVAEIIRSYERREVIGDRVTSLLTAIDKLDKIRTELWQEETLESQEHPAKYHLPELNILLILLRRNYEIIKKEIYRLRGNARIEVEIGNKELWQEDEVTVALHVTNKGMSAADNVEIVLDQSSDFSIVDRHSQTLTQLQTNGTIKVTFTIKPATPAPRLCFHICYDDSEKRGKRAEFADVLIVKEHQRPYAPIPNPYTSGTPIRDQKMFYGRQDDINALRNKLISVTANKVVVLSGQRRMGKTSLIYQLSNELAKGPYLPVLIDLQGQAMQDMGQLFSGFASRIIDEMRIQKNVRLTPLNHEMFTSNPTAAFDSFITEVQQNLQQDKLVFLLDEFEVLQEKINQGPLSDDVLNYLRSLMQHRQGLNFLLVGAPGIRFITEKTLSVFFNIALNHQLLTLKSEEAEALITQPVRASLEYDVLAVERMRTLSGDQPYFIHVMSEILIAYCNERRKSYVTVNDVNNVLERVIDEQAGCISWIWNQRSSPLEKFLLSVLAQERGEEGKIFSPNDIWTEFDAQGVPYEPDKVSHALQNLKKEDIIEERFDGKQFRIPIGLVKEWLRKAKPPERVVREEMPYED